MKMKSIASALCLATLLCSTAHALDEGDSAPALSIDSTTGETHRRHHVTADGFYRGKKVLDTEG